jgi:hypothetical protein
MKLDDCIQRAIDAGEVDRDLGTKAQAHYRELVQRYSDGGTPRPQAEQLAADEAIESIIKGHKSRRHATLQQLDTMRRNEARYEGAHLDPDRILKDVELAQSEQKALERGFLSAISDALTTFATNPLGMVRNRAMLKDVIRELHGQASGNATAKAMADAIRATQERARAMFNALGGDIGKLDDYGVRHTHDGNKIAAEGFDGWFGRLWDGKMLDWHRMIDHDTGKPFTATPGGRPNRKAAERFLKEVYESITSRGWTDRSPSMAMGGKGLVATRAEHRVLHFRDGDAWMDYNELFGTQNPFDAIIGHFRGMARDIALMRQFGPNPKMGLNHAIQVIEKQAAEATGAPLDLKRMRDINSAKGKKAKVMMNILTGEANVPHAASWAAFLAGTRNLLTAAQLGGATLSTTTDWASARMAAAAVGLNPNSHTQAMIRTLAKGMTPQQARDMGYIFDTWADSGAAQARFMGDIWSPEITNRITNAVLRLNGLAFITDRARVAVSMAFGSDLADLAGKAFDDLPQNLQNFMASRRIGAREWDAVRDPAAIYTDPTGGRHINAEWFRVHTSLPEAEAQDIAIRWGALVSDHMEMAIPSASLRGRATLLGDAKPGSLPGEFMRSGPGMYKSFLFSQLFGQIRRVNEMQGGPGTKAVYVAQYVAMMTIMGALSLQLKEIAKGRDPRPMTGDDLLSMETGKFWGAALLQGGGIGIFGDFFASNTSRAGGGLAETVGGPIVGLIGDVGRTVVNPFARLAEGKDPLIGRDVSNLVRRYNPLATFQPPIPVPTRLALDRILWDQLQYHLDPEAEQQWRDYERRIVRDTGTRSFWRRGEVAPDRVPALSNVIGQ